MIPLSESFIRRKNAELYIALNGCASLRSAIGGRPYSYCSKLVSRWIAAGLVMKSKGFKNGMRHTYHWTRKGEVVGECISKLLRDLDAL
jgi:hypothetical protein